MANPATRHSGERSSGTGWKGQLATATKTIMSKPTSRLIKPARKKPELKKNIAAANAAVDAHEGDHRWTMAFRACATGHKLAVTDHRYLAMAPPSTRAGDEIRSIYGLDVPFVFRRCL